MKIVNLAMKAALRDRLKVIAAKEGSSMVDMVEKWIMRYEDAEKVIPPKTAAELYTLRRGKEKP